MLLKTIHSNPQKFQPLVSPNPITTRISFSTKAIAWKRGIKVLFAVEHDTIHTINRFISFN